jgi:beta-mannosidase
MQFQSLTGKWQFRQAGTEKWLPATVPGGVHTDLLALGLIPDPFVGDNEKKVMWVAEKDWQYKHTFTPTADVLSEEKVFLVADGLDTIAEIKLNGKSLGKVNNQFRQWRWEVKDLLKEGENNLEIDFSGPATYVAAEQKRRRLKGVGQAIDGGPHMRKAPCQFGWDWGPMLPPIGVWKDIRLEGRSVAQIEDVHLRQIHKNGGVTIRATLTVETFERGTLNVQLKITNPDGQDTFKAEGEFMGNGTSLETRIEHPLLWWPNGYPSTQLRAGGVQNLYEVVISLKAEGHLIDKKEYKLGLRTIELRQENDEFGKSFQFVVNGVPIFAKGSNWIPADSFLTRFSDERLEKLIADAAAGHQNMLRVWGGGLYEEERFYNLCDKYGILVWQDFIFSCSIYPMDEADFIENVRIEAEENIKRLRHRASLALWCGNNEMEGGWESWGWAKHPMEDQLPALVEQIPALGFLLDMAQGRNLLPDWEVLKNAYDQFFHHKLPAWVADLDPDTPYWPSSPSSDTPFQDSNGHRRGDAHFWDVWHGRKPFTAYRQAYPRFMSEFGFQAFPTMETVEFYAAPEERNLTSYIMEHHQRGNHGNGLIIAQMTDTFRMPENFTAWIYLSLVLQAEGIRYGVEHWRRNMHRVSGALYWQLNDCWPVASWASIDYFGRWKALHYASRRFYAPVLLSVEDKPPVMDLHISSDLTEPWQGTVLWSLESLTGEVVDSATTEVTAAPLADTVIASLDFGDRLTPENERDLVLVTELRQEDEMVSLSVTSFVPTKHLNLTDPQLKVTTRIENGQVVIDVTAQSLARFVELRLSGAPDVVFRDNYFDIPAGRTVTVGCPLPEGWTEVEAKKALKVYSLYNSFHEGSVN